MKINGLTWIFLVWLLRIGCIGEVFVSGQLAYIDVISNSFFISIDVFLLGIGLFLVWFSWRYLTPSGLK